MPLNHLFFQNRSDPQGKMLYWDTRSVHDRVRQDMPDQTIRTTERLLESSGLLPACLKLDELKDETGRSPVLNAVRQLDRQARRKRFQSLIFQLHESEQAGLVLFANDGRMGRRWLYLDDINSPDELLAALQVLAGDKNLIVWPHGELTEKVRQLAETQGSSQLNTDSGNIIRLGTVAYRGEAVKFCRHAARRRPVASDSVSNLDRLEAESIHIMREAVAQATNPVMLNSLGKNSSVMLHLAKKAFYPSIPPFPLMHVDTDWKFQATYDFRDSMAESPGIELIVYMNAEGIEKNINPYDHGSTLHSHVMETEALIQALEKYRFDVAFGGARRSAEKSRAKERVFSLRSPTHQWNPINQPPEIWSLFNSYRKKGESLRVFPLSNWTELDIWQYIYRENIAVVPLYFSAERPVVERDGQLLMVDDDRCQLFDNEPVQIKRVRFRTLGCYPLTGAIESDADDLQSIILELLKSGRSERQGCTIDSDSTATMEIKKQSGYF